MAPTRRDDTPDSAAEWNAMQSASWSTRAAWVFFSTRGRIPRVTAWRSTVLALALFAAGAVVLERVVGPRASLVLYPVLYYALLAVAIKRAHDIGRSGAWMLFAVIPLVGTLYVALLLGLRRGTGGENRFGPQPRYFGLDYFVVRTPSTGRDGGQIANDVTQLNPVAVLAVVAPTSVAEVQEVLKRSDGPISIGGGHFSMGGQTASPGTVHLDMRRLNQVVWLAPSQRRLRVQAGIRWCDVQRFLDAHGLAVKIMQTYANFTVGGALSVNAHGRYVGAGPLVLSVRAIDIVMADGTLLHATPDEHADVFYGAVGGYGGLGVVVEVELELARNERLERVTKKLPRAQYLEHFRQKVRSDPRAVLHNADLYPPHYRTLRSVTWVETEAFVTATERLMRVQPTHLLYRYLAWSLSESPWGKWQREHMIDPLLYLQRCVHWRNYEAGYDVAELEPEARRQSTYVLQEYFVPVDRFDAFVPRMAEVFRRHGVNVINVSVRHAHPDPGTLLAWAREEVFAFVVYYKQRTDDVARNTVAVWTRELIDAALACGGGYYLPYQPHATPAQFHAAYPRARELFALKTRLDPEYRFRNALWDTYYAPEREAVAAAAHASEIHGVLADTAYRDRLYQFLQNVYHLVPEDRFHALIRDAAARLDHDEGIYRLVQEGMPGIRPTLAPLTHAIPALRVQKAEMLAQTLALLGERRSIRGYLEIGSTGRYLSALRKRVRVEAPLFVMNDVAPSMSPVDVVERGQLARLGRYLPLADYAPLPDAIASGSLDVVACYIGLHHAPRAALGAFVASIARVLREGGVFVLRDHDAGSDAMKRFVSVVHTVFNCGLDVPWSANQQEARFFVALDETVALVEAHGLVAQPDRLRQPHDPTDNVLLAFVKPRLQAP